MTIPFNTRLQLSTDVPARSWIRGELLEACATTAAAHRINGTFFLAEETGHTLTFVAKLTSELVAEPVTAHYVLPSLSRDFEADRPHAVAEALAELALTAADGHDFEQGELIRLIGLQDAVLLTDSARPDIV